MGYYEHANDNQRTNERMVSDMITWVQEERAEISRGWNDYQSRTMAAAVEWLGDEAWLYSVDDFVLYDEVTDEWELGLWWAVDSGLYEFESARAASAADFEEMGREVLRRVAGAFTSHGFVELRR